MLINGIEFDFNPLNASHIQRIEDAQAASNAADAEEKAKGTQDMATTIRGQCRILMTFLDHALGDGASQKLGLDGDDFRACKEAAMAFYQEIRAEQEAAGFFSME